MSPPDKPTRTPSLPPPFLSLPRSRSGTTSSIQSVNSIATLCVPSGSTLPSAWGPSAAGPARLASMARYAPSAAPGRQSRRPSLMSIKSLNGTGSSGTVSKTSARGFASRSRSTPLSSTDGMNDGELGSDSIVTSPLEETPGSSQIVTKIPGQLLQPGSKQRSPSEEALLYSLEAGTNDSRGEQHTLQTFVDSRRESPHPNGSTALPEREMAGVDAEEVGISHADPLPISSSLTASDDRLTGEESSRSIGRHSIETFRTARATPANGSIREKAAEVPMPEVEVEDHGATQGIAVEQQPEVDTAGVSAAGDPALMGGVVWRLGTWVYSSMPSLRSGAAPSGGASESISVVNADRTPIQLDGSAPAVTLPPVEPQPLDPKSRIKALDTPHQLDTPVVIEATAVEQPGITPSQESMNHDPPAITSWADTFRWRKGASSSSVPAASTPKPESVDPTMEQDPSLEANVAVTSAELQRSNSPNPASRSTELSPLTSQEAGQARSDGWASYFRPRLERDPLLMALQVAETQSEDKSRSSLSGLKVGHVVDSDGQEPGSPMDLEPQESATSESMAPPTSSRWWFRKAAAESSRPDPLEQSKTAPLDKTGTVVAATPHSGPPTIDPPEPLIAPFATPPVRLERKLSIVSRKNLVLPSWTTTFNRPPRSSPSPSTLQGESNNSGILPASLPKIDSDGKTCWDGIRRVVIIGVHGWFPNTHIQKVVGAPRTSGYFCSMMGQSVLAAFEDAHGIGEDQLDKLTYIPLDGEGGIDERTDKLYNVYTSRSDWVADVRRADAVFVAAHSQGCIVATHLLARIIASGDIISSHNSDLIRPNKEALQGEISHTTGVASTRKPARVALLSMCGVHLGPFYNGATSTVMTPYLWFEHPSARELFDFQDTSSRVSQAYQGSLRSILADGVKVVLLSSLDDQMVPIYSGSFSAARHPRLLRALYVDSSISFAHDFILNLITLGMMILNAGLDDQGLISHLSEATAGAWHGVGHSSPYEDPGAYDLAVSYLLRTSNPDAGPLEVEEFGARDVKNDYELPWILRGVMDDATVQELFRAEIKALKDTVLSWQPNTRALRDIKKRLEPMAGRTATRSYQKVSKLQSSSSAASLSAAESATKGLNRDW